MDTALGVAFKDFVILAADRQQNFSILKITDSYSKIFKLTSKVAIAMTGEPGDIEQFSRYTQCRFNLEKFRDDGWEISLFEAFNLITWDLAQDIRSRNPSMVNPILGGFCARENRGRVFWLDYMGTGTEVTYGVHGYGEPLAIAYLDRHHKADMNRQQAIELVTSAIDAMQTRIVIAQSRFELVLLDKDGIHQLPDHVVDGAKCHPK